MDAAAAAAAADDDDDVLGMGIGAVWVAGTGTDCTSRALWSE